MQVILRYPNGNTAWNGSLAKHLDGKLAWNGNRANYSNGTAAFKGKTVYYKENKRLWDGHIVYYPDKNHAWNGSMLRYQYNTVAWSGSHAYQPNGEPVARVERNLIGVNLSSIKKENLVLSPEITLKIKKLRSKSYCTGIIIKLGPNNNIEIDRENNTVTNKIDLSSDIKIEIIEKDKKSNVYLWVLGKKVI
ncbi:hypothetical protein BWI97_13940 [Siphonobacter sp. BAB-5405]|nr:hypothetical protein BWI97_13940 [Siphonobacter sp. BAB-5405]